MTLYIEVYRVNRNSGEKYLDYSLICNSPFGSIVPYKDSLNTSESSAKRTNGKGLLKKLLSKVSVNSLWPRRN